MRRWRRARQKKAPVYHLKARDPFCGALDADSGHFRSTACSSQPTVAAGDRPYARNGIISGWRPIREEVAQYAAPRLKVYSGFAI